LSFPAHSGLNVPRFFSDRDGLFLLNTTEANSTDFTTTIYTTHDGGKTWAQLGSAPFALSTDDFLDINHVWATKSTDEKALLYASQDGGLHWKQILYQAPFANFFSLSFVSATLALCLGGPTPVSPEDFADGVFTSRDGGLSWQELVDINQLVDARNPLS